ncbi:MAG: pantetheine-phosphate adenylyltransferase [Treponema sp.]|nr:MAG: pantetheine-phosphate adenylyltransferase [Treponema sp.]
MRKAVFAGSFDPPTYGHVDIVRRASKIFDELHIVIAVNNSKKYLFSDNERFEMMEELVTEFDNVKVVTWSSLIVNYADKVGADALIRGVRNVADFSYEFDLALLNKGLNKKIETLFMVPDPKYFVLRSSSIKELASFGGELSSMVPPVVQTLLKQKFKDMY